MKFNKNDIIATYWGDKAVLVTMHEEREMTLEDSFFRAFLTHCVLRQEATITKSSTTDFL